MSPSLDQVACQDNRGWQSSNQFLLHYCQLPDFHQARGYSDQRDLLDRQIYPGSCLGCRCIDTAGLDSDTGCVVGDGND